MVALARDDVVPSAAYLSRNSSGTAGTRSAYAGPTRTHSSSVSSLAPASAALVRRCGTEGITSASCWATPASPAESSPRSRGADAGRGGARRARTIEQHGHDPVCLGALAREVDRELDFSSLVVGIRSRGRHQHSDHARFTECTLELRLPQVARDEVRAAEKGLEVMVLSQQFLQRTGLRQLGRGVGEEDVPGHQIGRPG